METKDIFDRMARRYDTPERIKTARIIGQAVRNELSGAQAQSVMDYGCGTGLVGFTLIDTVGSMLFVDASPQMIAIVQQKIEDQHIDNARALCADFLVDPPTHTMADYILLSQVLLHVRNFSTLLKTLYRALMPGGHLILVDFDKNERVASDMVHNGFDQQALLQLLLGIGFDSATSHTFHEGERLFMQQDASLFIMHARK